MDRFPLANESELGENERLDSRANNLIKTENEWGVSNSIPSEETVKTVEDVKHSHTLSTHEIQEDVNLQEHNNSVIANTGGKAEAESFPTTFKFMTEKESSIWTTEPPMKQKKVLLLSSVGRSGSSFLGLLLAALGDNMYFFEPIRGLPKNTQNKQSVSEELVRYFRCDVRLRPFPKRAYRMNVKKLTDLCRQQPLIIVKVIRVRLEWVRELMNRKDMDNVKVIHLVRDPRGSLTSIEKLEWKTTEVDICTRIYKVSEVGYSVWMALMDLSLFLI